MRAWTHTSPVHPSQLTLSNDIPQPTLKLPTQVLVRITHAALNPGGLIMVQLCPSVFRTKPCIPELDFAGTIVEVGKDVPVDRGLTEGLAVFGSITVAEHMKGAGALAEYVVLSHETVVPLPKDTKPENAAGLTVAGTTALALFDAARIHPGMKILVNGVSGGIGTLVLQMIRDAVGPSGHIFGICSGKNAALAKSLGCHEVIDYQVYDPVHQYLANRYASNPFDLIVDAHGIQNLYINCAPFLKETGGYITVGVAFKQYTYASLFGAVGKMMKNSLVPKILGGTPRHYVQVSAVSNLKDMERLKTAVEEGRLQPIVDRVWGFEDVPLAYDVLLNKRAKGKIVIKIQD